MAVQRPRSCGTRAWTTGTGRGACCAVGLCAVAVLCGCQFFRHGESPSGRLPLSPLAVAPNQAQFEVVFVQLPSADPTFVADFWHEVDEQSIADDVRRRLARNGFRIGVIGIHQPPQVAELLKRAVPSPAKGQSAVAEATDSLGATQHQMFLHSGQAGELVASGVMPQFQVLHWKEGRPQGATFQDGQAQFSVFADPQLDGRVRVELSPEIHYGSFQQRYVSGDGMFRVDNSRKKQVFDDLRVAVMLEQGEMLVIGGRPERPGSLGDRFFRESADAASQSRLLLLRLDPSGHDPAFGPVDDAATDAAADPAAGQSAGRTGPPRSAKD